MLNTLIPRVHLVAFRILADRQKLGGPLNFNWVIKRLTVNRQNFSQTISLESMWSSSPVLKTAGVDQLDSLLW